MMKFARTAFVLALILPAAACNTTVYDMEALQRTTPQGTEFTKQMAADYLSLAQSEARQFDWIDSNYFAKKGRRAAAGEVVLPEDPDAWSKLGHLTVGKCNDGDLAEWMIGHAIPVTFCKRFWRIN